MNNLVLNFPTFGFVVATRALLGLGIGLLIADRLPEERRHAIGVTLLAVGVATTIPAAVAVLRSRRELSGDEIPAAM